MTSVLTNCNEYQSEMIKTNELRTFAYVKIKWQRAYTVHKARVGGYVSIRTY